MIERSMRLDAPYCSLQYTRPVSLRHRAIFPHQVRTVGLSLSTHLRHHYGVRPAPEFVRIIDVPSLMNSSASHSSVNVSLTLDQETSKEKGDDGLFELSGRSSSADLDNFKVEIIASDAADLIIPLKVSSGQTRSSSQGKCTMGDLTEVSDTSKSTMRQMSQDMQGSVAFSTVDNTTPTLTLSEKQQRLENLISRSIYPFLVSSWRLTKQRLTFNASGLNPNKGWVILSVVDVAHFLQGIVEIINARSTTSSYGTDAPQVRLYCNENTVFEPRSLQNTVAHSRLPKTIRETVKLRQNVHDLWVNIGLDAAERSPLVGIRHSTNERQGYIIRRSNRSDDDINKYEGDLSVTRAQVCCRKANGKVELRLKSLFDLLETKNEDIFNADNIPATMNVGGKEIYGNDRFGAGGRQDGHSSSDDVYNIPSGYKVLNTCIPAMGDTDKPISIYRFFRNMPTGDYFTFLYANSTEGSGASFRDNLVPGDQNYLANWLIETDKIERPQTQMDEVITQSQDSVKIGTNQIDKAEPLPSILSAAAIPITSQAKLCRMASSTISHSVLRRKSVSAANMFALYPQSTIAHVSEPALAPPAEQPVLVPCDDPSTPSTKLDEYQVGTLNEENSLDGLSNFQIEAVTSNVDISSEQQAETNDLDGYDFQIASSEVDSKVLTDSQYPTVSTLLSQLSISMPFNNEGNDASDVSNNANIKGSSLKSSIADRPAFPTITPQDYDAMEDAQQQAYTEGFTEAGSNSTLQALCIDTGVYINRMSFEEHVFMPHIFLEILLDLIVNARQYSKPSIVRASLFNCQESLYLIVNDCGIGLPKQCWQHAFFHQQELADISQCLGSGLARAILITRAYGGIINVSSCKNGGTRLILKIPLPKETTFIDA